MRWCVSVWTVLCSLAIRRIRLACQWCTTFKPRVSAKMLASGCGNTRPASSRTSELSSRARQICNHLVSAPPCLVPQRRLTGAGTPAIGSPYRFADMVFACCRGERAECAVAPLPRSSRRRPSADTPALAGPAFPPPRSRVGAAFHVRRGTDPPANPLLFRTYPPNFMSALSCLASRLIWPANARQALVATCAFPRGSCSHSWWEKRPLLVAASMAASSPSAIPQRFHVLGY